MKQVNVFNFTALLIGVMIVSMVSISFAKSKQKNKDIHHEKHHTTHHDHKHHFAVFSGLASNFDAEHTDLAIGADYEHRLPFLHNQFGIGAFGEYVFAEHAETILGLGLFYHPGAGFKFMAAPAVMFAEAHAESHNDSHHDEAGHYDASENNSTTSKLLFRFGLGRDFHVGNFSISPTLNLDVVENHKILVYGLTLGKGF